MTPRQTLAALDSFEHVTGARERRRSRALRGLIEQLPDRRELLIVCARRGLLGPPQSVRDLAARLGISSARVAQLETRALERIERAARAKSFARPRSPRPPIERALVQAELGVSRERELRTLERRLERMLAQHKVKAPSAKARQARARRRQALEAEIGALRASR